MDASESKSRRRWAAKREQLIGWTLFTVSVLLLMSGAAMYYDIKQRAECLTNAMLTLDRESQALLRLTTTLELETNNEKRRVAFTAWAEELRSISKERSEILRERCDG